MKKLLIVLALGALAVTGAFAQLTFGITGVQYYADDVEFEDALKDFQDGEGVYYGGFVEVIGKNWGLGLSFNFDPYEFNDYDYYGNPIVIEELETMAYDVNLYMAYHFFGGRFLLDPFVQVGFGINAFGWSDGAAAKEWVYNNTWWGYVDEDDPWQASLYWDIGLGLGVNLGPVGIFTKVMYNNLWKSGIKGTYDDDAWYYFEGAVAGEEYDIPGLDPLPVKWVFGGKILL